MCLLSCSSSLHLCQFLCGFQLALMLCFSFQSIMLFLLDGGCEKVSFQRVQSFFICRCPFACLCQTCATIQLSWIAPACFPLVRRLGEMTMQKQAFAILSQPLV